MSPEKELVVLFLTRAGVSLCEWSRWESDQPLPKLEVEFCGKGRDNSEWKKECLSVMMESVGTVKKRLAVGINIYIKVLFLCFNNRVNY